MNCHISFGEFIPVNFLAPFLPLSMDIINFHLIDSILATKLPLIASSGMATEKEIDTSISFAAHLIGSYALGVVVGSPILVALRA